MANTRMPLTSWELEQYGGTTEVSDWVLTLDLSPEALALYVRFCFEAQNAERGGSKLTITQEWADRATKGRGSEALEELQKARVLTKLASYRSGKTRLQEESFPPVIQDVLNGSVSRSEVPELAAA